MSDVRDQARTVFLSYLDDQDNIVSGYVQLIRKTDFFVEFRSTKNLITIPMHRILKIKEAIDDRGGQNS